MIKNTKGGAKSAHQHRMNGEITGTEVRLTDQHGESHGVMSLRKAKYLAEEAGLDLVEISPTAQPPVCKIMDYGKYLFEKSKAAKEQKKKQKQVQTKEVKFRPGTDEGDYQVKLRNLTRFLNDGNKGKVTLRFRGREMAHQDLGIDLLNRIKTDLDGVAVCESFPRRAEGRQMTMMLAPAK